jgi:hypothetical protein
MTASDQVPTFRNLRTVASDDIRGVAWVMVIAPDLKL